jgi:Flp pilus assembly protein TadG
LAGLTQVHRVRRYLRDQRGQISLVFALTTIPLLSLIGAGVDFTRATRVKMSLQNATDSAALALARDGLSQTQSQLNKTAEAYVKANYDQTFPASVTKVTLDKSNIVAEVDSSASVPTTFLRLVGMTALPVKAHAVTKGLSVEIAMVLDTSYSMTETAGNATKISALKEAGAALLDTLFRTQPLSQRFKISVVPFATSVNVGAGNASAAWIDTGASSPIHYEDFDSSYKKKRLDLFDASKGGMKNVSWGGCVISRPSPHDIDDTEPKGSTASTLFVPWFAPDEPENNGWMPNNYLDDEGGDCTTVYGKTTSQLQGETEAKRQARTCKYKNVIPSTATFSLFGTKLGPNFLCDAKPITPLTNTRATLDGAVAALTPGGTTNILEGFTWGWRTLSPAEPFTQGKAYNAPNNRKVIVLMTDGENFVGAVPSNYNMNMSSYSAYGYLVKKRLTDPVKSDEASNTAAANAKVLAACTKAKAQKIAVYTIAFGADAAGSKDMLSKCATSPSNAYAPLTAADLKPVFVKIAESINQLRIAE